MTDEFIEELGPWLQYFKLPSGKEIGKWDTDSKLEVLFENYDLQDKTVMDVACMSGAAMLWAMNNGAKRCHGFDIDEHVIKQANAIKEVYGVDYQADVMSVYDLGTDQDFITSFGRHADAVICMGLYYHLLNPILGIQKCWDACDELLVIEGEVAPQHQHSVALFVKERYKNDSTNWWIPSVSCFEDWLTTLKGFSKIDIIYPFKHPQRIGARVWR